MSHYGPFATRVGLYQRFGGFIDLIVRNSPDASGYRLWVSATLNDAYGTLAGGGAGSGLAGSGGTMILEAENDSIAVTTPNGIRSAQMKVVENRKGQTSFQIDPRDISLMDEQVMYFRVQERRRATGDWLTVAGAVNNGLPIQGPILVVPPAIDISGQASAYTLYGLAPSNTGCTFGSVPFIDETLQTPLPMHIVFPRPVSSLLIRNSDTAAALLISYGPGQPMISIEHGAELVTNYGHGMPTVREIFLARPSGDGGCVFTMDVMTEHFNPG